MLGRERGGDALGERLRGGRVASLGGAQVHGQGQGLRADCCNLRRQSICFLISLSSFGCFLFTIQTMHLVYPSAPGAGQGDVAHGLLYSDGSWETALCAPLLPSVQLSLQICLPSVHAHTWGGCVHTRDRNGQLRSCLRCSMVRQGSELISIFIF